MSQVITNVIAGLYEPSAFEKITVADTAIGFTASNLRTAGNPDKDVVRALISTETAPIRYRCDGTSPTSTVGHLLPIGSVLVVMGQPALDNFRAIRTTGTSGVIQVTYER